MNGRFARVTSQTLSLAIEQVSISTLATGGVCWPMARLRVTMTPKCTGSMPTAWTTGITIGTTRMIAAAECRNMPMTRKNTFRIASTAHFSLVIEIIALAMFCGSCASVRYRPSSAEAATSSITEPVCTVPSMIAWRSRAQFRSR